MAELNIVSMGIKTVAMLAIVLGLLLAVLYLVKRTPLFQRERNGDGAIKVVSSLHLSPKEKIEVVEIAGERIVLGITPNHISFLTRIDKSSNPCGEGAGGEDHHEANVS